MLVYSQTRHSKPRQAMILLVVLTMLTLFALVGISFVLVAQSQETSARLSLESEMKFRPQIDPEAAMSLFLGQMLYDVNDDAAGVQSALRGHSLARNMYGWYYDSTQPNTYQLNDKPYTGTGRLHATPPPYFNQPGVSKDEAFLMNYQFFAGDGFLRDPERTPANPGQFRQFPTDPLNIPYTGGFNVSYTYPDHNNFYLAHVDPTTGQVTVPSFHREYLFGKLYDPPQTPPLPPNPNWNDPKAKYLTLRPHPTFHPNFPQPVDRNGDVKNLDGAPGGADSLWIDIGAPVMTSPDGRKYKMLVAPLILDLDNRINLNVVGNILASQGATATHRSNQGWGPWEMNPSLVLNADQTMMPATPPTEWLNIFYGSSPTGPARVLGRYDNYPQATRGLNGTPQAGASPPRGWSFLDYDGRKADGTASNTFPIPTFGVTSYMAFPQYANPSAEGYGSGGSENTNHAGIYSPLFPQAPNQRFSTSAMARLLRQGGTGSDTLDPTMLRLLPKNLAGSDTASMLRRNLVTLISADLDRPGVAPYNWNPNGDPSTDPAGAANMTLGLITSPEGIPTLGKDTAVLHNELIPFPALSSRPNSAMPQIPPSGSEFDAKTWRSISAALGRITLNRILPPYPLLSDNWATVGQPLHQKATQARQAMAQEIYDALRSVTGAMSPTIAFTRAPGNGDSPEFKALRYLAQLAVNIVDYIDVDEVSTPFKWFDNGMGTYEYVFGYELPRLVINETYAQYDNEINSLEVDPMNAANRRVKMTGVYNINLWAELMNPIPDDNISSTTTKDCEALLQTGALNSPAIYRMLIIDSADLNQIKNPANTTGDPDWVKYAPPAMPSRIKKELKNWGDGAMDPRKVIPLPIANRWDDPAKKNTGFYVVGPKVDFVDSAGNNANGNAAIDPQLATTIQSKDMTYTMDATAFEMNKPRPVLVLQRLANPRIPADLNATAKDMMGNVIANPFYNPFITVDLVEHQATEIMDGRNNDMAGPRMGVTAMTDRKSFGRRQPFAAGASQRLAQNPATILPADMNKPKNTFFIQNARGAKATVEGYNPNAMPAVPIPPDETLKVPFDWPVHLDRLLLSPGELLNTTALRPFEALQYFYVNGQAHRQVAPWTSAEARIYRFLDFVSRRAEPRGYWGQANGRLPGMININTVWDQRIFQAMFDSQASNVFSTAEITTLWNNFRTQRSQQPTIPGPTDQALADLQSPKVNPDQPFWSLGIGTAPATPDAMLQNPITRRGVLSLLDKLQVNNPQSQQNPYLLRQSLSKVFNHFTTRSNSFAIWMTVGFFEVGPDTYLSAAANAGANTISVGDATGIVVNDYIVVGQGTTAEVKQVGNIAGNVLTLTAPLVANQQINSAVRIGLKGEVGKSENRHIRYRMFSIVDRTHMQVWPTIDPRGPSRIMVRAQADITPPAGHPSYEDKNGNGVLDMGEDLNGNGYLDPSMPFTATIGLVTSEDANGNGILDTGEDLNGNSTLDTAVQITQITNPNTGRTWSLQDGAMLTYEPNTANEETVRVRQTGPNTFVADFTRKHPKDCVIVSRGNPGPWQRYDPRKDSDVVPFFMVLD